MPRTMCACGRWPVPNPVDLCGACAYEKTLRERIARKTHPDNDDGPDDRQDSDVKPEPRGFTW